MHDNDSTPIEAIDFSSLKKEPSKETSSKQESNNKSLTWLLLSFILVCAVVVFFFLPKYVEDQKASVRSDVNNQVIVDESVPVIDAIDKIEPEIIQPALSAEQLNALKNQAEDLLLEIIKIQNDLEGKAVKLWAAEEYKQATAIAVKGDEFFRKQNYVDAISGYEQGIKEFTELQKRVQPTLENHLDLGEQSLLQGDGETAIYHFEIALKIDADNQRALNGVNRSQTISELFGLLEKGGSLEAANRLKAAQQMYQKAVELDPLSNEAKQALSRVENRLIDIEFSRLLAKGYTQLGADQYQDAKIAFKAAQKLKPSSDKPKAGINKVNLEIRNEKIASFFVEAQHFENDQQWALAAESYKQILTLSSNSIKAKTGLVRCQKRADYTSKLDEYINSPSRLYSDEVAAEVEALIQEISVINQPGSKITQQINILKEILEHAKQPVAVTLLSDNQTHVVIYKVAKLGQFDNHEITLKPGKYTIVGSRPGFRDVRKVVLVSSDMQTKRISVKCEEQI